MNERYWLERVVLKLNQAFLSGKLLNRWAPDEENPDAESRALDVLEIAGIIKSPGGFEGAPKEYQYRVVDLKAGFARSAPTRLIVDFDYDKFLHFCEANGFNPATGGMSAKLEIVDGIQPVVSIGQETYTYKSLSSDSTVQAIVAYAHKQGDKTIYLDELRENISRQQLNHPKVNIIQLFKASMFNQKDGSLRSFAIISTKSFMLKRVALLAPSEVAEIKKLSAKKD